MTENDETSSTGEEEGGKTNRMTMILGAISVIAVITVVYSLNSKSKLEDQVKTQQVQILKQDSLLQKANQDYELLKAQYDRAQQSLKKAAEHPVKPRKTTKSTQKKSKTKKT